MRRLSALPTFRLSAFQWAEAWPKMRGVGVSS